MYYRFLLFLIILLVISCTEIARNNPFDEKGTNHVPPTVTAMGDTTVPVVDVIILHATGDDKNGTIKEFQWSFNRFLSFESTGDSIYTKSWGKNEIGSDTVWVKAVDNDGLSSQIDSFIVTVNLYAPTIIAMVDTTVKINTPVIIHSTGIDVNGSIISYYWATNSTVFTDTTDSSFITCTFTDTGDYVIKVKCVDDDSTMSNVDSVTITAISGKPYVEAEYDFAFSIYDQPVKIAANGYDLNGTIEKYYWALDGINYSDSTDINFILTTFPDTGKYKVKVYVRDNENEVSDQDSVFITIILGTPPKVIAMNDTSIALNTTLSISATGIDSVNEIEKYYWAFNNLQYNDSTDVNMIKKMFTNAGLHTVYVLVRNSLGLFSQPDSVKITVIANRPTVKAMENTQVTVNNSITITALGDDVDGTVEKYYWALNGINFYDSTDNGNITTSFDAIGSNKVLVKVRDNDNLFSLSDSVYITVVSGEIPTVNAMDDDSVKINDSITITAVGGDDDGYIERFYWALDGVNYSDSTATGSVKTTFNTVGQYEVSVRVRDNDGNFSFPDTVIITAVYGAKPRVTAMNDTLIYSNTVSSVNVYASASDSDGTVEKFYWAVDNLAFNDSTVDSTFVLAISDTIDQKVFVKVRDNDGVFSDIDSVKIIKKLYLPDSIGTKIFYGDLLTDSIGISEKRAYNFTATAGDKISIRMYDISVIDPEVSLYDPSNNLIATQTGDPAALVDQLLSESGTYVIYCKDAQDNETGSFQVKLICRNQIQDSANQILYGDLVTDSIGKGDMKAYKFEATVGDIITIRMYDISILEVEFSLYDPNDSLIATQTGNPAALVDQLISESGTYVIYCKDEQDNEAGSFQVKLLCRNQIQDSANQILYGDLITDSIGKGDMKAYKFEANAGDIITIRMYDVSILEVEFSLYSANGNLIAKQSGDPAELVEQLISDGGTYIIYCKDKEDNEAGSYQLKLLLE